MSPPCGARRSGRGRGGIGVVGAGRRVDDEELGVVAVQLCFVHFCGLGPSPLFIQAGPWKESVGRRWWWWVSGLNVEAQVVGIRSGPKRVGLFFFFL